MDLLLRFGALLLMILNTVKSNMIYAIGYQSTVLVVIFKTGKGYNYFDVPEPLYKSFLESDSKGSFFNKKIVPNYKAEQFMG